MVHSRQSLLLAAEAVQELALARDGAALRCEDDDPVSCDLYRRLAAGYRRAEADLRARAAAAGEQSAVDIRDKAAKLAVKEIVSDLCDRRGLESEWASIDADIRSEIKRAWQTIIADAVFFAVADAAPHSVERSGCPCTLVEPCGPDCTCANPVMSGGCLRCCRYGSVEQRMARARQLASPAPERSKAAERLIEVVRAVCAEWAYAYHPAVKRIGEALAAVDAERKS